MSDYADGAEAMRKAILARFAEIRDGYEMGATRIVRGIILEDRRSMVCLTPRQAHGLADWMRRNGAGDGDSIAPALTVLILDNLADEAERGVGSRPPVYIPGGTDASGNRHGKDCPTCGVSKSEWEYIMALRVLAK